MARTVIVGTDSEWIAHFEPDFRFDRMATLKAGGPMDRDFVLHDLLAFADPPVGDDPKPALWILHQTERRDIACAEVINRRNEWLECVRLRIEKIEVPVRCEGINRLAIKR